MKSLNVELSQVAPHHGNDAASILHHIAQESTSKPLCTLRGVDSGSDAYELRNIVRAGEPEGEPRVYSQALDIGRSTFSDYPEKADVDTDPGESPQDARHASRPVGTPALRGLAKEGSTSIAGADGRDFDGLLLDVVDQRLFLALAGTRIASMNAASAGDTWRRPG